MVWFNFVYTVTEDIFNILMCSITLAHPQWLQGGLSTRKSYRELTGDFRENLTELLNVLEVFTSVSAGSITYFLGKSWLTVCTSFYFMSIHNFPGTEGKLLYSAVSVIKVGV